MNQGRLIARSLRFFARSHIGTLLGAVVGTAVLVGALAVGDSVRESLRRMALQRLGEVGFAMTSGDRFFRSQLAGDLEQDFGPTASALQLAGTAGNQDGSIRANRVQVLGINSNFWAFAPNRPGLTNLESGSVVLNHRLAEYLKVRAGDEIVLRVHKPSLLSRESPISPQEDFSVAMRLQVATVLADNQLGNFSLLANQVPPFNAFISMPALQAKLDLKDKANLLVTGSKTPQFKAEVPLRKQWQLADADLYLHTPTNGSHFDLRSGRIFIDGPIAKAALGQRTNAAGILTYFVNEFRVGEKLTPYSMVTAAQAPIIPEEMRDDEILVNDWLANDLQAKAGDTVALRYFVVAENQQLEERTNAFRIRAVIPMNGVYADRDLMPDFPGIAKAEKTENWDAGFPIDMTKIRPKDEDYWKEHRGTPKAFITLAAGQQIWGNRFGSLTAIRYQGTNSMPVTTEVLKALDPASIGLAFEPVRDRALAASSQGQDFGQLFLGFSFFLIAAALILIALLYAFAIEQRAGEVGTLLAIGLAPRQVRRMLLAEGAGIALLGGIIGTVGGIFYAQAMLRALTTIWRSAIGTSALIFHVNPGTLLIGAVTSVLISTAAIWVVLRKQAKTSARELLAEGANVEPQQNASRRSWSGWIAMISGVAAIALIALAIFNKEASSAGIFFGAGALLLICGVAATNSFLKRLARADASSRLAISSLGIRNATRRRKRSLATVALLASGGFLVLAVSAFRLETTDTAVRSSGTGGFQWIGETTLPVVKNLNTESGRDFFGLNAKDLEGVKFLQFRVRDGDDASCLNLNQAQRPRVLGVDPSQLQERNAFSFTKVADGFPAEQPWLALRKSGADEVPAIADAASIQYALKKKVGDTIDFVDEHGNPFKIRIVAAVANSILQGNLIIDEGEFLKRFPGETGYRMFLIDAPSNGAEKTAAALSRALRDVGLELTSTRDRLAAYNAVQNTYLGTFQVLGGLGLLLGTFGLGVVVLRNVLERRAELGLLHAVAFRKRTLEWLVISEHAGLLLLGLAIGVVAAMAAIAPALFADRRETPIGSSVLLFGAIVASGLLWTWLATKLALRGHLLKALRDE